eukprot:m.1075300 g.1075300  ORF g.1075300 m.1075300 type:complete len:922 (-) comp24239_c0_seq10:1896-4661(-)
MPLVEMHLLRFMVVATYSGYFGLCPNHVGCGVYGSPVLTSSKEQASGVRLDPLLQCHFLTDDPAELWTLVLSDPPKNNGQTFSPTLMTSSSAAVHMEGQWWVASPPHTNVGAHDNLELKSKESLTGTDDVLGSYTGIRATWTIPQSKAVSGEVSRSIRWITTCKSFTSPTSNGDGAVVFESEFPDGASRTSPPNAVSSDGVLSYFPAVSSFHGLDEILSWESEFISPVHGRTSTGIAGGPVVFYNATSGRNMESEQPRVLIASPINHFKPSSNTASEWRSTGNKDENETLWAMGTAATITSLPPGFVHRFMMFVPNPSDLIGITGALDRWGRLMQALSSSRKSKISKSPLPTKQQSSVGTRVADVTVSKLQLQTDNGAQYCFCTEDCDTKLLATLHALEHNAEAPRLGSLSFQGGWWQNPKLHTSGCAPWCVSTWDANTSKFPSGAAFHTAVGLPFQLYAPYFCMDTPYASDWNLMNSDSSLPGCSGSPAYAFKTPAPDTAFEFYKWFMEFGQRTWGMTSFEPDFMHQNTICVREFLENVSATETWFQGLSDAADHAGVAMQWCMATPGDVLMAMDFPSVTNFRVSTDYYYGRSWDIGVSSLLVWALGAAPSKDTFWTSNQSDIAIGLGGCPAGSGCPADHSAAGAELHSMLAVFSTGPVGFGDAAGRSNVSLLRAMALADGTLVKPSRPVTAADVTLMSSAWNHGPLQQPQDNGKLSGFILVSHSGALSQQTYPLGETAAKDVWGWYVLGHQLTEPWQPAMADLYPRPHANTRLVWRRFVMEDQRSSACRNGTNASLCVSSSPPILPAATEGAEFYRPSLVTASRVCPESGWIVVGSLRYFAALSTNIFADVECTKYGVAITMAKFSSTKENPSIEIVVAHPCATAASSTVQYITGWQILTVVGTSGQRIALSNSTQWCT